MIYDVVVIGGGPAGLTAAIYAARAGRTVLVLEKESFGGQILYTPVVDNYPACAHISGMDLGNQMAQQAMDAGAELVSAEVTGILHAEGESFSVETDIGLYVGKSVILATGARHRHLGLPREDEFVGRGVSYCGVCDGAFYAGKKVAVVGGGNTALTNALFLAERCREVVIIHFFDEFQAESKLVEQVRSRTNIFVLMVKETKEIIEREGNFAGLEIMDRVTEAKEEILCDGVFISVGQEPQSTPFALMGITDDLGYYDFDETCKTFIDGLFVAGDGRAKNVRQLTTAVADGAVAGLAAAEFVKK